MFFPGKIWRIYLIAIVFAVAIPIRAYELEYADKAEKALPRWSKNTVSVALSNSLRQPGVNYKANSDVVSALQRSLKTWEAAANVKFVVVWTDKQSVSDSSNGGDGVSLIIIADTPENNAAFQGEASIITGLTRLFFHKNGRISEADIVLNPFHQFSTDGTFGTYDVEAALTHELGHLLGLSHSSVMAATMYGEQGKNGTFSLPSFAPRTLAEDDRAGARWLYGAEIEDETCCGAITGTITSTEGKQLSRWQVWAEDKATGKLFASVETNASGVFQINGLSNGTYRVVAQQKNKVFSAEIVGEATIKPDKVSVLNRKLALRKTDLRSLLVGSSQLGTLAIPLSASEGWQTVFLGGANLALENASAEPISISSPFFEVDQSSWSKQDFDAAVPVFSFNLKVNSEVRPGEYSLRWQKANGETTYLLGCFVIADD